MNWGTGIVISIVAFMSFILYLVYGTFQQNIDLVAEDYYQQEIAYQNVIDESSNYEDLEKELKITEEEKGIRFEFPHDSATIIEGTVSFYRPANKTLDKTFPVDSNVFFVDYQELTTGLYLIKTNWTVAEINYYKELSFFVQK